MKQIDATISDQPKCAECKQNLGSKWPTIHMWCSCAVHWILTRAIMCTCYWSKVTYSWISLPSSLASTVSSTIDPAKRGKRKRLDGPPQESNLLMLSSNRDQNEQRSEWSVVAEDVRWNNFLLHNVYWHCCWLRSQVPIFNDNDRCQDGFKSDPEPRYDWKTVETCTSWHVAPLATCYPGIAYPQCLPSSVPICPVCHAWNCAEFPLSYTICVWCMPGLMPPACRHKHWYKMV